MYTQFWPKTAFFWSRGADFDPKTQKYSETSCYNPKPCIPGQNLVSERLCHFWGLQAPQPPPRPPQTPPRVPGAQKWPKCTCTSPVLIINDKKTTFGWVNILTYFFTRNVPKVTGFTSAPRTLALPDIRHIISPLPGHLTNSTRHGKLEG